MKPLPSPQFARMQQREPEITRNELDQAVAEFLQRGGTITRLDSTNSEDTRRRVNLGGGMLNLEDSDWEAELDGEFV